MTIRTLCARSEAKRPSRKAATWMVLPRPWDGGEGEWEGWNHGGMGEGWQWW